MDLFDIIGPVMIGPSSSHTAGAAKIGRAANFLLGEPLQSAQVTLYGSFAKTGVGHGTDRAIAAGLLGFLPDDARLRNALEIAPQQGCALSFLFDETTPQSHPNTVHIEAHGATQTVSLIGQSVGGGHIAIVDIDGMAVDFSGAYHTLLVSHPDRHGSIAAVLAVIEQAKINIARMSSARHARSGPAMMIIETDTALQPGDMARIRALPICQRAVCLPPI